MVYVAVVIRFCRIQYYEGIRAPSKIRKLIIRLINCLSDYVALRATVKLKLRNEFCPWRKRGRKIDPIPVEISALFICTYTLFVKKVHL